MTAKKGRPASLTSSLLARKGEAEPARLADGSVPRDVMALHEEIVARLASEIERAGAAPGGVGEEPAFDFLPPAEDEDGAHEPAASPAAYQAPVLKSVCAPDAPDDGDTDFDYEAHAAGAPHESGPGAVRPAGAEAREPSRAPAAAPLIHPPTEDLAPRAVTGVPSAPFVALRAASDAAPDAPHPPPLQKQKMIASLPTAFAVMVAVAIGGALGLWFAEGFRPGEDKSLSESHVADAAPDQSVPAVPMAEPAAEAPPAPLPVPGHREVAVTPLEAPSPAAVPSPSPSPSPATSGKAVSAPVAEPARAPAAIAGAYGIQLLSTPKESDAEAAWSALLGKHKGALGALPHEVVRADLGAKGIYYRLRAGSFDKAADARALCKTLAAAKQACMVVKR